MTQAMETKEPSPPDNINIHCARRGGAWRVDTIVAIAGWIVCSLSPYGKLRREFNEANPIHKRLVDAARRPRSSPERTR